jgi:exonuclease SbcC
MPLEQIKITNFQSHKNTELNLNSGINAITGSSDVGKSSITRAIYWVLTNRPTGTAFQSYWADKDGTTVELVFDGTSVKRIRSKTKNSYELGKMKFDVVKTDVPEEVLKFLNLSDVNIQNQHDKYFLLQDSAGEVAKKLNSVANLEIIDFALKEVNSDISQNSGKINNTEVEIYELKNKLEGFKHLDKVENLLSELSGQISEQEGIEIILCDLIDLIGGISTVEEDLQNLDSWLKIEFDMQPILENIELFTSTTTEIESLQKLTQSIEQAVQEIALITKYVQCEPIVDKLLGLISEYRIISQETKSLQNLTRTIESIETEIEQITEYTKCEPEIEKLLGLILEYRTVSQKIKSISKLSTEIAIIVKSIESLDGTISDAINDAVQIISENKLCPLCGGSITKNALEHIRSWL